MLKIKTILLFLCCITALSLQAQNNISSPFSRLGYGFLENGGSARSLGMGRVAIASRSNLHVNTLNPASYSSVDTLNHIYDFAVSARLSEFEEGNTKFNSSDVNFQYLTMAFPVTSWMGMAASVEGVSFVGYEQNFESTIGDEVAFEQSFQGSGGLSKVVLGAGFNLNKNVSLGVNANYIFGPIDFNRSINFSDNSFYDFTSTQSSSVHGFQFSLGTQFGFDLTTKDKVTFGATYEPAVGINGNISLTNLQLLSYSDGTNSQSNPIYHDNVEDEEVEFEFPESYGFGVMYQRGRNFSLGADIYLQKWSEVATQSTLELDNLNDRLNVNAGFEYIPDFISPKYLSRVSYRMGGHYSKSYFKDGNEDIIDYGINFGVGLPLRYSKTSFNIGVELGKVEALSNSTVKENYIKLLLSCSLHEVWFFKRKFE